MNLIQRLLNMGSIRTQWQRKGWRFTGGEEE